MKGLLLFKIFVISPAWVLAQLVRRSSSDERFWKDIDLSLVSFANGAPDLYYDICFGFWVIMILGGARIWSLL